MPGVYGLYSKKHINDVSACADEIGAAMNHVNSRVTDTYSALRGRFCAARVHHGILDSRERPVTAKRNASHLIFHGELYHQPPDTDAAQHVLDTYLADGAAGLADLNGIFHFALLKEQQRELHLVSDKFGLQPLYYATPGEGIVFAGEVKAVLKDQRVDRAPDHDSFADFFHFGQILGNKTLLANVNLLPPGSILVYHMDTHKMSLTTYWDLLECFVEKGYDPGEIGTQDAVDLLIRSIEANSTLQEKLGLSLSGGLDSRGILAGLQGRSQGLATYTLGLPGCADEHLALKMANLADTRHEFIPIEAEYIRDFDTMARKMIYLSDGMYHPHESTEIVALKYFESNPFRILLRGHGGEVAKAALAYPVMVRPEVQEISNSAGILEYILRSTNLVIRDISPQYLFSTEFSERMRSVPKHSLEQSCDAAAETLVPADACLFYYIREHIRRQVVSSLDIFRSRIDIRMPYVDADFFKALFRLPLHERMSGEIHCRLVQQCMPALMKVVNSNTGAPLDAGPLRLLIADKIHSLLKRMNIKGFRHYTEFQKWHREGFMEHSRNIIFSDAARQRNLYNIPHLEQIFEQHISGRKDYGHLLGTIVGLELWHMMFLDT